MSILISMVSLFVVDPQTRDLLRNAASREASVLYS